jgi:PilZ domain
VGSPQQAVGSGKQGVVILSRDARTRADLSRLFSGLDVDGNSLPVAAMDLALLAMVGPEVKLVVLDLENWVANDELALNELRTAGYDGPVIVLTKRVGEASSVGYIEERIIFYDRTHGVDEILGIGRRLIEGALRYPRKHPRHITNETAEVWLEGSTSTFTCKVRNISKGGALLELVQTRALVSGDLATLKINLSQLKRIYHVKCRICWVALPKFGVEFTGNAD